MQYDDTDEYFASRTNPSQQVGSNNNDDDHNPLVGNNDQQDQVPVTPGISNFSYVDAMNLNRLSSRNTASQTRHNSSTAESNHSPRPGSPTEVARGVKGEDLLRSLSLAAQRQATSVPVDLDPRAGHEGLHLSGHVISATFTVPYKIAHNPGQEWASLLVATSTPAS